MCTEISLYANLQYAAALVGTGATLEGRNIVNSVLDNNSYSNNSCYNYHNFAFYILGQAYLHDGENSSCEKERFRSYEAASKVFGEAYALDRSDQASKIHKAEVEAKLEQLIKRSSSC